ncbi:lanthionine synthetase LanC family protein [Streptomyces fradiae]|uniref:lanthionine synthetase LanC family protein n=1 Tax=Streptomyces fradiae TaxID=1906 RepID=UPI0033CEBECA
MQQPPESPAGPPPAPPAPRPATAATASASGSAGAPHGPYAAPFPDGEADVRDLAVRYLAAWTAAPDRLDGGRPPSDPGVPVLARTVASLAGDAPEAARTAADAVAVWARRAGRGPGHTGLHDGGLSGTLVGLRLGAALHPRLRLVADRLRDRLADAAATRGGREEGVRLADYDLIVGPAGGLLAHCAGAAPEPRHLAPYRDRLVLLCDSRDLRRLRADGYAGHPHLSWLQGRVNTGMGHGAAGVATALAAAVRHTGPAAADALRRVAAWLEAQEYEDERGVRTWPGAGLDGRTPPRTAVPRQAWCYGAPGVAWALWDAADALGDRGAADRAAEVFARLADRYDEGFHLYGDGPADVLGLCHGAGGVLAVADAFARHAGHGGAARLRDRMAALLRGRLPEAVARAVEEGAAARPGPSGASPSGAAGTVGPSGAAGTPGTGASEERAPGAGGVSAVGASGTAVGAGWSSELLTGAPGALAALLTAGYGASRTWLPCLGLR